MLKGEIWWAVLPRARGSEPAKTRPVLIVQSQNVAQRPAVKDVLPARISKLRSSLQGLQNVAEQNRAEGEARTRFCGA